LYFFEKIPAQSGIFLPIVQTVKKLLQGCALPARKPGCKRIPACVEKQAGWRYNILRPEQAE